MRGILLGIIGDIKLKKHLGKMHRLHTREEDIEKVCETGELRGIREFIAKYLGITK